MESDNIQCYNRRESDTLESRLCTLEIRQLDNIKVAERHTVLIEKLVVQDSDAMLALTRIDIKFDELIKQIGLSFKILMILSTGICTVASAFWIYSHDLDQKYAPKIDKIMSNSDNQDQKSINRYEENKENIQNIEEDVTRLQNNRVNKASK